MGALQAPALPLGYATEVGAIVPVLKNNTIGKK